MQLYFDLGILPIAETSPEQLKDLETIEATVRQQVTQYVSPELGIFLSKKRQEQVLEESEN
ncbi:MAG TPA: hypothetical protein DCY88_00415 [Cyanobacteria bacterium UBA11372]|nr:hypothetical protein [Cyanobacteria bacterium UBA11372]